MSDIGLECSVNTGLKVFGVFKHLYEDFHVREIRSNGEILQLRHLLSQELIRSDHLENMSLEAGVGRLNSEFTMTERERDEMMTRCHFDKASLDTIEKFVRAVARYEVSRTRFPHGQTGETSEESRALVRSGDEIRANLCRCQGIILPPTKPGAEGKALRKEMHEVIRSLFPFLETDTALTGEVFESQGQPTLTANNAEGLKGELAEAAAIRCVYEPKELLEKFEFAPYCNDQLLSQIKELEQDPSPSSETTTTAPAAAGGQDQCKFFRLKLKKVAAFYLTGRPLQQAPSSRDSVVKWNNTLPPYLEFTLFKQNRDTADAISSIAGVMGLREKLLSYAGTKDKRGVTVQRISLFRCTKSRLLNCTTYRGWDRALKVCDLEYSQSRVALGSLKGNHFKLAIRRIPSSLIRAEGDDSDGREAVAARVAELIESVKNNGFINYYGNQRFGTRRIKTWEIGAALIRHDWLGAIGLILGSSVNLDDAELKAEQIDWRSIGKRLRPHHTLEKKIVNSLVDTPKDFHKALRQLHKNSLALYYHAVQSLIWNKCASERYRTHGLKVVVGDIVILPREGDAAIIKAETPTSPEDVAVPEVEGEGERAEEDALLEEVAVTHEVFQVKRIETEEEAAKFSADAICLPLIGKGIQIPSNLGGLYDRLCQEVIGQNLAWIDEQNPNQELVNLEGSYRRLIVRPTECAHKILYNIPEDQAVLASDLDRLLGRPIALTDDFTIGLQPIKCEVDGEPAGPLAEAVEKADKAAEDADPVNEVNAAAVSAATEATEASGAKALDLTQVAAGDAAAAEGADASHDQDATQAGSAAVAPRETQMSEPATSDVLLFSCSLPKGSYLTCLLREILDDESVAKIVSAREPKAFNKPQMRSGGAAQRSDRQGQYKRGLATRGRGDGKRRR